MPVPRESSERGGIPSGVERPRMNDELRALYAAELALDAERVSRELGGHICRGSCWTVV